MQQYNSMWPLLLLLLLGTWCGQHQKAAAQIAEVQQPRASRDAVATASVKPIDGKDPKSGFVLPSPDETAVRGINPSNNDCQLFSALYAAMGAGSTSTNCGSSSSSSNNGALQDTLGSHQQQSELLKSSARFRDGLFTNKQGDSFCISSAGAAELAQSNAQSVQFASISEVRELPDIEDPACEDVYASQRNREGCVAPPAESQTTFLEESAGEVSPSPSPSPDSASEASPSPRPEPLYTRSCSMKFTRVGTQPRSVAIVLLRWRREYYKSEEKCCQEQDNKPGCGCDWSGTTWDSMPALKAYTRLFTDECDKGPSLNRAYFDMTGGRITFHSKLRVPVPSGRSLSGGTGSRAAATDSNSTDSANEASPPSPEPSPEPYVVPTEPVVTPTSYLDPNGVDVYGWATLDAMRDENGHCKDWCGDAVKQLGVNDTEYNHVVCLQFAASPWLCNTCKDGEACIGTCPAESGITTGCGCATCYYAWGGQSSCSEPAPPGVKAGLGAFTGTYKGELAEMAGGEYIIINGPGKTFLGHEIGHNMGLTHTSSLLCKFNPEDGSIDRDTAACKPSWYGDSTSFMGSGQTLQLPAAIRYKVKWLPRNTLKLHTPGTERRWLLRPITIRRPSWQAGRRRIRWFGNGTGSSADALAIRIPLINPADGRATTSSYTCPCNPMPDGDPASPGLCPGCSPELELKGIYPCENGPCCLEPKCADKGLTWYYVELHMPFRNDYGSTYKGVAIRMMGELASSNCTSTRQVPTHVEDGKLKYLLDQPDPSGETPGSKFVDTLRGVTVVLERWTNTSAVVRITT